MEFVTINGNGAHRGHYSAGVISNGMLYISGQLSMDIETRRVPDGDIKEHTKLALLNLDRVLKAAGVQRTDVVQCRVYLPEAQCWDMVNEVYQDFFGMHRPARIVLPVKRLHYGCMVEVEAIAEVKRDDV